MNISRLSWENIISNPLNSILSLLLMTFGVAVISILLLLGNQIEQKLQNNLRGIDMVVGAKGSPIQLILSSVYHLDNPTGNILFKDVSDLVTNPMVDFTIPLSYGDSYNGFRIVGATPKYLKLYNVNLREGKLWSRSMEVVVGSVVAEVNQLQLGDTFFGSHGLIDGGHVHDNYSYKIVGILNQSNSIIDNLVLTSLKSVWKVHHEEHSHDCSDHSHVHESLEEHDIDEFHFSDHSMITAMLVKFKSPVGLIKLPRMINENTKLQAAVPAFEVNRLIDLFGFGFQTINTIALIIILVSGLSIFISLYNSLKKRRYELALMRVYGANKWQLIKLILLEGFILSFLGTFFGLLVSRLALFSISLFISHQHTFNSFRFNLINEELWLFPLALSIGLIASIIPTIIVYKTKITQILSNA